MSVAIGTFGGSEWEELARARAIPSVPEGIPIIHRHDSSLARARNAALADVETEWVIHLDADDELAPGYIEQMREGSADLRGPAMQMVKNRIPRTPQMPMVWGHRHSCRAECLREGNWLCIGTAARADMLREVGGWEEWGWSEDWALWARCWYELGASCEGIPGAIYRAFWNVSSRNRISSAESSRWHREIEGAIFG